MSEIAVIDIGSNSVRLVIFDRLSRAPQYLFNEKALCRLGRGLSQTGMLNAMGVLLAKEEILRFMSIVRAMNVKSVQIVATAAMREAKDGLEFCEWLEAVCKVKPRILSGEEEAYYSAQGVLLGWPNARGIVCDMGGSSMELVHVEKHQTSKAISLNLGPLRLENLSKSERKQQISTEFARAKAVLQSDFQRLYLVGGSWRALAKLDMFRRDYPLQILHEYLLDQDNLSATMKLFQKYSPAELSQKTQISLARLELVPSAVKILKRLIEEIHPERIAISAYGLREGLLYSSMSEDMRQSDPLLQVCADLESAQARFPGFGDALYNWITPLRGQAIPVKKRILKAACLLHDINWRYHPDYRAKMSFELISQANICGITHKERVFLAVVLAARYGYSEAVQKAHQEIAILTPKHYERAVALGRIIRLGAMLSASISEVLNAAPIAINGHYLTLAIKEGYEDFYGENVKKRLQSFGKIAGYDVQILRNNGNVCTV